MKIYNTMTMKKEEFKEIEKGKVKMYSCGPTVYNYFHIGNARPFIVFDILRSYLEYIGYEVTFVQNFTDVDDKIIKKANEEGISAIEVADKYIDEYYKDAAAIGIRKATVHPRVTENIKEIISFIQDLIDKGFAYVLGGDVYFEVKKFDEYGKLSHKNIDELVSGARIDVNEQKKSPLDFALWKEKKEGEIGWDSPWGVGRPGWHIECSVMATKHLGDTIDIHGGGQDLAFPHHENEIAQSESKTGHPFARYWMHNAFVTMGEDGEKMSKSLGNFVLVHDIIKEIDPQILRFFLASAHYRRPLKFSESSLQEATANVSKIQTTFSNTRYRLENAVESLEDDQDVWAGFEALEGKFQEEMDDDFNAANGMTVLYQFVKEWNVYLEREAVSRVILEKLLQKAEQLFAIFGMKEVQEELVDDEIQALIDERLEARKAKNFARSDEIRELLKAQGIVLEDTAQGTRWRRV